MLYEYLLLFFCTIPLTMLASPGLALLFEKAGVDKNKAFIPVVNQITFLKITGKNPLNVILEFVPVINIISFALDLIDFVHCYGKRTFLQQMATVFGFPIYFLQLGKDKDVKYLGTLKEVEATLPPTKWYSSLIFAIVAATLVRWAFIEAYKIPTSSMEGSMLVNDFLFVSKIHYGPRTPQTPLQVPLTHQQVPFLNIKSYSDLITLPSYRLPGLTEIKRGKPMVFNYPSDNVSKITDMKTFYVKRCVGIAGDTISFVDGQLYVNGDKIEDNDKIQYKYKFQVNSNIIRDEIITRDGNNNEIRVFRLLSDVLDQWKIVNNEDINPVAENGQYKQGWFIAALNKENAEIVKNSPLIVKGTFQRIVNPKNTPQLSEFRGYFPEKHEEMYHDVFPYFEPGIIANQQRLFTWNIDNFGPLWLPAKGKAIELTPENVLKYANTIAKFEGYKDGAVTVNNLKLYIDGKEQKNYTFKNNYYWLCGDNRHNSLDSRYWGFVPEDHIVGKPFLTFFSYNKYATSPLNKIRWDRIFRFVE